MSEVKLLHATGCVVRQPQQQGQAVACGGCGNADPDKVCIGCLHPFAAPQPKQQGGGEVVESGWYYTDTGQRVQVWRITQDDGCWCSDMKYHCGTTLYTAPPSAPVGVEALLREYRPSMDAAVLHAWAKDVVAALAQQPAAVDEAMAERFCRRWYEITGRSLERAHVLASLDAAIATQHQEPTT